MPRIRTIKPDFFSSLTIAELPLEARLTFIGLWTHVDDEGRCVDDARLVKAALWPLDDRTAADVETDLRVLSEHSLISRYEVDGRSYLQVSGWDEHQRINRPTASKLPAPEDAKDDPSPPSDEGSPPPHSLLTEGSLAERNGREGNREGKGTGTAPQGAPAAPTPPVDKSDELTPTAKQLVTQHIAACHQRPPSKLIAQVAIQVQDLLADDTAADDIAGALALLRAKPKLTPSLLPSLVEEHRGATRDAGEQVADVEQRRQVAARNWGTQLAGHLDRSDALDRIRGEYGNSPDLAAAALEAYDHAAQAEVHA